MIAGFCEIGETAEETVRREVMEEVGLHVKNIRYYKSQPWGFAGDLLMGFFCEVDGSRSVHLDEKELESARWVTRGEIGNEPANVSLTADMIMHFKHEVTSFKTGASALPGPAQTLTLSETVHASAQAGVPAGSTQAVDSDGSTGKAVSAEGVQAAALAGSTQAVDSDGSTDRAVSAEGVQAEAPAGSTQAVDSDGSTDRAVSAEGVQAAAPAGRAGASEEDAAAIKTEITTDSRTSRTIKYAADMLPDYIRGIWFKHVPGIVKKKGTSAVVIPLIKKDGEYHILYEQRADGLAHQPGEICFPGGRLEPGEEPKVAALRETAEELIIDVDQIELLAAMDAEMGPGGAPIWPFVAVLHDYQNTFSTDEVSRVFTIPLSWYQEHVPKRYLTELVTTPREDFPYELIPGGRNYPFRKKEHEMVFYQTPEAVIWGVTAKITDEFLRHLQLDAFQ